MALQILPITEATNRPRRDRQIQNQRGLSATASWCPCLERACVVFDWPKDRSS